MPEKKCSLCKEMKDYSFFYDDKGTSTGKASQCIPCKKKRRKELESETQEQRLLREAKRQNKNISGIVLDPEDPDLEIKNRARYWADRFGAESAMLKAGMRLV